MTVEDIDAEENENASMLLNPDSGTHDLLPLLLHKRSGKAATFRECLRKRALVMIHRWLICWEI